jgi:hypothetical protein
MQLSVVCCCVGGHVSSLQLGVNSWLFVGQLPGVTRGNYCMGYAAYTMLLLVLQQHQQATAAASCISA